MTQLGWAQGPGQNSGQNSGQNNYSDVLKMLGIGGGLGQIGGGFYNLFGGGKNPADVANQYLNKIPGQTQQYYQPYMNRGEGANNTIYDQYGKSINDPGGMYNKFASGYTESPGYQNRLKAAMGAITNQQAAGGMAGSPQAQEISAEKASNMSAEDFQNYMNSVMGIYNKGTEGMSHIGDQGFQANQDYASQLANLAAMQAQLNYSGQQSQNEKKSSGLSNIFSGAGSLLSFLPGGSMLSGLSHLFGG
jgi:hypothetical protein